jgi:hypothetical protein
MTRAQRYMRAFLEFGGGAAASEVFLGHAEEFAVGFATIGVTDLGLSANIELSAGRSVVNGGCVRVDIVRGNGFVASEDIEGWELCFMVSLQYFTLGHTSILGWQRGSRRSVGAVGNQSGVEQWIVCVIRIL